MRADRPVVCEECEPVSLPPTAPRLRATAATTTKLSQLGIGGL